jgi:hypothetical protein
VAVVNLPCGTLTEVRNVWVLPSVRQRLGLALFSISVGLIAGTVGLALMAVDHDSDPRSAFAFAPVQTLTVETAIPNSDAEVPLVKTVLAREVAELNAITREITQRENVKPCRGSSYEADSPCVLEPSSNAEVAAPKPNPPVATVVRTRHDSDRTIVAEQNPAASPGSTPTVEVGATPSTDASPAVAETPTLEPPAAKPRYTERQQNGQRHPSQRSWAFFDSRPRRGRQQHFWPFW